MFYTHVASVLFEYCIFNERFNCSIQHKIDVVVIFFPHHQWIANNFFQHGTFMLPTVCKLFFDVDGVSMRSFPSNIRTLAVPIVFTWLYT